MLYAIVDIETTGGHPTQHGITEIGVVVTDGKEVKETFETLVNPQQEIPSFIAHLTGISDAMVADAPLFDEIKGELFELLKDKVFVAHNVNFDYKFIRGFFAKSGVSYDSKRLCTVRLGRKVFPGLKSYSLGKFATSMGVKHTDAHRALGDAAATAELFNMMYQENPDAIAESLKANSKEATLPANLPKSRFDELPKKSGIYRFYDAKGKIIYVGKAKNIRKRVSSHFTGESTPQKAAFARDVFDISHEETGTPLVAAIVEDEAIKRYWPEYNRAQKHRINKFGIFKYEDRQGGLRLGINKIHYHHSHIKTFPSMSVARKWLFDKVEEFNLKPGYCGLPEFEEEVINLEDHNTNFQLFLEKFDVNEKSFAILGNGRKKGERSFVLVEKGQFKGYGFYGESDVFDKNLLQENLVPQSESLIIRSIIASELENDRTPYGILEL